MTEKTKEIYDEDKVNKLWDNCLKYNSFTIMGGKVQFDVIADMVIGRGLWQMRSEALMVIRATEHILSPQKKIDILKVAGASKMDIASCKTSTAKFTEKGVMK